MKEIKIERVNVLKKIESEVMDAISGLYEEKKREIERKKNKIVNECIRVRSVQICVVFQAIVLSSLCVFQQTIYTTKEYFLIWYIQPEDIT
jgi:hypothetical protein